MKTPRIAVVLALAVTAAAPITAADLNVAGNLTVTGTIDSDGNTTSFGALTAPNAAYPGVMLTYTNDSMPAGTVDSLKFLINRNPASWLWLNNTGTAAVPVYVNAMRLDSAHQLLLFNAAGTTAGVTLTPVSNQISLGTATLTGSGANLTVGGGLTVTSGITNNTGAFTSPTALNLSAGGTNQNITLTPSGSGNTVLNGNVGIGTSSPVFKLDVLNNNYNAIRASGNSTNSIGIYIQNTVTNGHQWALLSAGGGPAGGVGSFSIWDDTAGAGNRFNITPAGNVGIGTTTPGFTLDANGQIHAHYLWAGGGYDGRIYLRNAGNTVVTYLDGATGANSFINNGGNVGINTAIPDKPLHVSFDSVSTPAVKIGSGTDAQGWYTFLGNDTAGATTSYIGNAYNNDAATFQIRMKGTAAASARLTVLGNGNVGIGTAAPGGKLEVRGDIRSYVDGYDSVSGQLYFANSANSRAWNWQLTANGSSALWGYDGTAWAEKMRVASNGNVGIGTTSPTHKLSVKGAIRAQEIIVDNTGWADYVFDESYRLAPLSEVEQHIKAEKHLPGIPSAAEIAEHGVSMGDMQSKLLSKIEELTLHMIQQEKLMSAQQKQLVSQQAAHEVEIAALRQQVGALQAVSVPKL